MKYENRKLIYKGQLVKGEIYWTTDRRSKDCIGMYMGETSSTNKSNCPKYIVLGEKRYTHAEGMSCFNTSFTVYQATKAEKRHLKKCIAMNAYVQPDLEEVIIDNFKQY
jgi:hypothetical protein